MRVITRTVVLALMNLCDLSGKTAVSTGTSRHGTPLVTDTPTNYRTNH